MRATVLAFVFPLVACGADATVTAPAAPPPTAGENPPAGDAPSSDPGAASTSPWSFVVVGDTHVIDATTAIPVEMVPAILADHPSVVLAPGDIAQTGTGTTLAEMESQLQAFHDVMKPLRDNGIGVYPVRGNHEDDARDSVAAWTTAFSGALALPSNGPPTEGDLTYSFTHENALFVGVDDYANIHQVNQTWLDSLLATNTLPHVFVFGHEPAFKGFHTDCLGSAPEARNTFWKSLTGAGAKIYFSGHDHFFDMARIDDGDGNADNDLYQVVVGTGGGPFPPKAGVYDGDNAPYTPVNVHHEVQFGYVLVAIAGADVTLTFKARACDAAGTCTYEATTDTLHYTSTRSAR